MHTSSLNGKFLEESSTSAHFEFLALLEDSKDVLKLNFEIAFSLLATLYRKFANIWKIVRYIERSSGIHTGRESG